MRFACFSALTNYGLHVKLGFALYADALPEGVI